MFDENDERFLLNKFRCRKRTRRSLARRPSAPSYIVITKLSRISVHQLKLSPAERPGKKKRKTDTS